MASHAKNLAEEIDREGKPLAGLRLEIPDCPRGTFKTLESHGYALRQRYGPTLKRHIRFDDYAKDLYLNVKLPGEEEWMKILPDFASREQRESEQSSMDGRRDKYSRNHAVPSREGASAANGSSSAAARLMTAPGPYGRGRIADAGTSRGGFSAGRGSAS